MRILTGLLFVVVFLFGCSSENPIYVISSSSQIDLPFKASKTFGFFDKENINIQLDSTPGGLSLIRFLNFSKYTVVIANSRTARKIESLSSHWIPICTVARKNSTIGETYILLIKDSLLKKRSIAISIIKGWNYGVDLLKDPAVLRLLTEEKVPYRFFRCSK